MLKLIIGNRTYSSWSMRGWLAVKQSGLPFEAEMVPMDTPEWTSGTAKGLMPSGKVPVLWDGGICVWDSLAIIDWLADRVGGGPYWPKDDAARGLARSIAAEMHSGFTALRSGCSMHLKRHYPGFVLPADAAADVARIDALWTMARTQFGDGGPYLFGAFGAADIMFAPVVARFVTYDVALGHEAAAYVATMRAHPWLVEWYADAAAETQVLAKYELPNGVAV